MKAGAQTTPRKTRAPAAPQVGTDVEILIKKTVDEGRNDQNKIFLSLRLTEESVWAHLQSQVNS